MTDIAGIDVARIQIRLPEPSIRTKAGSTLENPVTLVNLTPLPDFFYLAFSGMPASWASFDKESVNLFPNWSDNVNLTLTVPEETNPGHYWLEIEASSHTQDNVKSSTRLEVVVEGETTNHAFSPASNPAPFQGNQSNGGAPNFPPIHPEPTPGNLQFAPPPPFAAPGQLPRLQLDLDFGQLTAPGGQTAEQIAHLLNLTSTPQNFSLGLEGLPPEWITVQPPVLHLSPNWSETASIKIAVPVDGIPGRYLLGVKAVPENHPEATVWREFDIVILPPVFPAQPFQPGAPDPATAQGFPSNTILPQAGQTNNFAPAASQPGSVDPHRVAPSTPAAPHFEPVQGNQPTQLEPVVAQSNVPPVVPQVEQAVPQSPVGNQQIISAPLPEHEASKAHKDEPKQRGGLFGWKKKKGEPVQPEQILFVPIEATPPAPIEATTSQAASEAPTVTGIGLSPADRPEVSSTQQPELEGQPTSRISPAQSVENANRVTPLAAAERPEPETVRPVVNESVVIPAASTETVVNSTSTVPETSGIDQPASPAIGVGNAAASPVVPAIGPVAELSDQEVNSPIDEVITKAPPKFWWDAPAPATEQSQTLATWEENPAISGGEATVQAGNIEAALATGSAETVEAATTGAVETVEEAAEGPNREPAIIKTENFELRVENVKIQFELGTNDEQQISLVNLMSNPAFFNLKIEGLPETWSGFSYSQINLFPNWREQVYLRLEAPTDTTPGVYPASLVVTSPNLPDDKVEVPLEIEVLPSAVLADKLYRATGAGQPVKLPPDARVELILDAVNLTLTPDETLEQTVSIVNHSPIPDFFELKLEGLLESWYQFSTPVINLFPNWKEEFYLRVSLPQNAVPGLYPVRLMVKAQNYSELHTEQSLLLQVLPPPPKPVVVEEPAPEPEEENNPALDDAETVTRDFSSVRNNSQTIETSPSTEDSQVEEDTEEEDAPPAQPFSFASFFQQQNLVPGAVAHNPAPGPVQPTTLPVVPPVPDAGYSQPTSAIANPVESTPVQVTSYNNAPVASYSNAPASNNPAPANPFEKRPTIKMGQQSVLAPQASLAGIIPVITAQPEAPAAEPLPFEQPSLTEAAAPPRKRTFWQHVTGQGKEKPAPVTPRMDENVLWRTPGQTPGQNQGQAQATIYPSQSVSSQATQVNWQNPAGTQNTQAGGANPIGGASQPAQSGQRAYSPMSTGGEVARVQITLEKPQMTIVAGESATQQVFLMNLTSLPDNFELTIEGLPANWFSFEATTINLFPNWNEHTTLTINISDKVKPDLYKGRIVVAATAQTGVRAVLPIEIQVLAPLVVQARLQPFRGKGYKAKYEMLLRNRSMSEGLMTMQWAPTNEFSTGTFDPPQVVLGPGQTQHVKLQVMLRKKTPSDQARQAQPFRVLVQPQWTVAQVPVVTAPIGVEGEYIHRSRWVFLQRHPVLFAFLTIVLVIVLLWNLLLLPFIQNTLMSLSLDKLSYTDVAAKPISADQLGFNLRLKDANPLGALVPADVSFVEDPAKHPKGVVTFRMQAFVFTTALSGTLQVDPVSGDLQFVADNKNQLGSFPWLFIPPDKVVQRISTKLKTWLKTQNPPQRLDDVYIEGNTLFLKLRNCQTGEVACR